MADETAAKVHGQLGDVSDKARKPVVRRVDQLVPTMWKPGQSGNPGGRTKKYMEALAICRDASPEASRKLVDLMDSEDERIALLAADKVLERAWGKPKDFDPHAAAEKERPKFDPSMYSDEELAVIRAALRVVMQRQEAAARAIEAGDDAPE